MATEIEQIEDKIIDTVTGVAGIVTCETWQGEIADLLSQGKRLPAVWVIFSGQTHGEKRVIGASTHDTTMRFNLVLAVKNLRSRAEGSRGAYEYIEQIETLMTGLAVTPLRGFLWPVRSELILIQGGVFIYGIEVERKTY